MPFTSIDDIKNPVAYKRILKEEVRKVKGAPVKFQYFEGFNFTGVGKKPLLLVGAVKVEVIDEVKEAGAVFKAKGRCIKRGEEVEFAADSGKLPQAKLTSVLSFATTGVTGKEVESLGLPSDGDVEPGEVKPSPPKPEKNMSSFVNTTRALTLRINAFEKIDPARHTAFTLLIKKATGTASAGDFETAITILDEIEPKLQKAETALATRKLSDEQVSGEKRLENETAIREVAEANPNQEFDKAKEKVKGLMARSKVAFKARPDVPTQTAFNQKVKEILERVASKTSEGLASALTELEGTLVEYERIALAAKREETKEAAKEVNKAANDVNEAMESLDKNEDYKLKKARLTILQGEIKLKNARVLELSKERTSLSQARSKERKNKKKFDEPLRLNQEEAARVKEEIRKATQEATEIGETTELLEGPVKQLLQVYEAVQGRVDQLLAPTRPDEEPGTIEDNESLQSASNEIEDKVGEMAEASEWQGEQIADPTKHGTGRHGAQTGIEGSARREATKVRPDQANNPSGTAHTTTTWRKNIKWKSNDDGTRTLLNAGEIVTYIEETLNQDPSAHATSSLFLNPVVEKYAVDKALEVAKQCKWKWKKDGAWQRLKKLAIIVPAKSGSVGFGYAVKPTTTPGQMGVLAANRHIAEFHKGDIDIEKLMARLNVELEKDRTGLGAKILPRAKVILHRANIEDAWTNETQWPTDEPVGWELTGETVAEGLAPPNPTFAGVTAPAATI